MRSLASGLLLAVALTACTSAAPAPEPRNQLAGTSWVRIDDDQSNPHGATMAFTEDRASGHTGCNRWFASIAHDGEALDFGDVGTTRVACQSEVQAGTERRFLEVLDAARYAHYDQDALVLLDARQHVVARFNRAD
jgi:heat shock protein HslJ